MTDQQALANAIIKISRRTVMQDLLRLYEVSIDGQHVGKLWPFQTGTYPVMPGHHMVKLAVIASGTASSNPIGVDATSGTVTRIRTVGRGIIETILTPLARPAGRRALRTGTPIKSRFYKTPWIRTRVTTIPAPEATPYN